jgi:hypothetical protein
MSGFLVALAALGSYFLLAHRNLRRHPRVHVAVVPVAMSAVGKVQTKILTREAKPGQYNVYRAGLEWDLTDPIVIKDSDDFKSTPRWREALKPYRHQVDNLITFCRRLPVTLLADDVGLGKPPATGPSIFLPGGALSDPSSSR